eukprot:274826_1
MMERKPRVMISRVLIMIAVFIGASSAQVSDVQKKLRFGYCSVAEITDFYILDLSSKFDMYNGLCREEVYRYTCDVRGGRKTGHLVCLNGKWNIDKKSSCEKHVDRSNNYVDLKCNELKSGFIPSSGTSEKTM